MSKRVFFARHKSQHQLSNQETVNHEMVLSETASSMNFRNVSISTRVDMFWEAVEKRNVNKVRDILSSCPTETGHDLCNRENVFGLRALDMACVLRDEELISLLLEYEAQHNPTFFTHNDEDGKLRLAMHLQQYSEEVNQKILRLKEALNFSSQQDKIKEELQPFLCHQNFLRNALFQLQNIPFPPEPPKATIEVIDTQSILVIIEAPASEFLVTQYLIHYQEVGSHFDRTLSARRSPYSPFDSGSSVLVPAHYPLGLYDIKQLTPGSSYTITIYSWNLSGYSIESCHTDPLVVSLTSWFDPSIHVHRLFAQHHQLELNAIYNDIQKELCFWLTSMKATREEFGEAQSDQQSAALLANFTMSSIGQRTKALQNFLMTGTNCPSAQSVGEFMPLRKVKRGIFLAVVCSCGDKIVQIDDDIPVYRVERDVQSLTLNTANQYSLWLMRLLASHVDMKVLAEILSQLYLEAPTSNQVRVRLLLALQTIQSIFGTASIGEILPQVVINSTYCIYFLISQHVTTSHIHLSYFSGLKWSNRNKLIHGHAPQSIMPPTEDGVYGFLDNLIHSHQFKITPTLESGLYIAYLSLRLQQNQLQIFHSASCYNMFPLEQVRENSHVTRDEWNALKSSQRCGDLTQIQNRNCFYFLKDIEAAWTKLAEKLHLNEEDKRKSRLYLQEVILVNENISLLIVTPSIENVCLLQSVERVHETSDISFIFSPFSSFEHWFYYVYQSPCYNLHVSISSILEILLPLARHCQRQSFDSIEAGRSQRRVDLLSQHQQSLEEIWKPLRWMPDVIVNARESKPRENDTQNTWIEMNDLFHTFPDVDTISPDISQNTLDISEENEGTNASQTIHGSLRIYIDFVCNLKPGASLNVQISSRTTVKEIIALIVNQIAHISPSQSSPSSIPSSFIYEEPDAYSLIVALGKMEKTLPQQFHPLLLQNPWKQGKMLIRRLESSMK